jgi:DNA-binding MarR family transcriptional regulator
MLNHAPEPDRNTGTAEFMDAMTRLFSKAARIEKMPVDTGDGMPLYTSEVHLIDMAGRFPDDSMSSIAMRLGITKGAVSQTVKKLEDKGYIERSTGEGDNKTVYLRLTGRGKKANAWHEAYHARINGRFEQAIASLGNEDRQNLLRILSTLESIFDDCPEIRRNVSEEIS